MAARRKEMTERLKIIEDQEIEAIEAIDGGLEFELAACNQGLLNKVGRPSVLVEVDHPPLSIETAGMIELVRLAHLSSLHCSSFGDFHKALLNELRRSRHGVCVDLDIGKEILIPPVVNFGGGAAQLDFHTALDQVGDQIPIGIAGRNATVGIVRAVMQRDVAGVRVKDRNDLRLGIPTGYVVLDELHVEDRGRQVPFELQGADTEHHLHVRQFHRNINVQRFL
jgi:hypothetical protein